MLLRVRLDGANPRRWLVFLLARIEALPGFVVEVDRAPGGDHLLDPLPDPVPDHIDRLFRLEALVGRRSLDGLSAKIDGSAFARFAAPSAARPDLILDLCGDVPDGVGQRVWRLSYDGHSSDASLVAAGLAGRSPVVAVWEGTDLVASARIGNEARDNALVAYEDALTRVTTLIVAALSGKGPVLACEARTDASTSTIDLAAFGALAARKLERASTRQLHRLCYRSPHWRVGWRRLRGPDLIDLRAHPEDGWRTLPDDGTRFYADPFPIEHEGRTVLFVEDFDHRRGKAHISAVAFGDDGPLGAPTPVLEEPYHLSYPFVFARDGAFWLIPESCENGTVDLYRATGFPGGWVKETTLLSGIVASDATLFEHGGRWWMLATVRDAMPVSTGRHARGSYSDALHAWSAPDFRGPWTPHAGNPILIDIASARPAGRIVERDGVLIRPVQDCRRGYGEALSIARIDRLDDGGFTQTVETTLRAGPRWPGTSLHTLNRTRDLEFIDGCGRTPRFARWLLQR